MMVVMAYSCSTSFDPRTTEQPLSRHGGEEHFGSGASSNQTNMPALRPAFRPCLISDRYWRQPVGVNGSLLPYREQTRRKLIVETPAQRWCEFWTL
jgi:hypothetical protein